MEKQSHSVGQRCSGLTQLGGAAGVGGRLVWSLPMYQELSWQFRQSSRLSGLTAGASRAGPGAAQPSLLIR